MAGKKQDRRIQRTHKLLREALFSLIREKGFEALSVQEIIDRANVGRATFYAHFDNKEDLLLSGFDAFRASLKEYQKAAQARSENVDERVLAFSGALLTHVSDHRDLFQAMTGKRSGVVVQSVVQKLLLDLVRDDVRSILSRANSGAVQAEAITQFIAGGIFGLLMWWLAGRTRLTVDEMDGMIQRFATAVMKAAPQGLPSGLRLTSTAH